MRLFDRFDRIRIVNLPERSDRRREMNRELAKVGLLGDPRVTYFSAFRPADAGPFTSIGAHGVYLSQRTILRQAAEATESLLILEDDCDFISTAHMYEDPKEWDIFYGGYYASDPSDLRQSDIAGAHMMGFSREGVRQVSAYLENLAPPQGIHPPIDAAYVWFRRANPNVPVAFAVPPLAVQRTSRSDIAPAKWHHRLPFGRLIGGFARRTMERIARRRT